jgi:hypothetical protein
MTRLRVGQIGNVKKRHRAKYAHVLEEEQAYQTAVLCMVLRRREQRRGNARRAHNLLLVALAAAITMENIGRDIQYLTQPIERKYLTFANAHPDSFTAFFRFPQPLMLRLMRSLRIPPYFKLDNGSVVNGQEGMLVMLKFLAAPLRLIEAEQYFGWELTRLSRIKNWMLQFVYKKHKHRVKNYLWWHVRYIQSCKEAMQAKKIKLSLTGTLAQRTKNVAWIIDGYRVRVCRPRQPADQQQPDVDLQCLVYNKWKKVHNILF